MPIITQKPGKPRLSGDAADPTVRLSLSMPASMRAELDALRSDTETAGQFIRGAIEMRLNGRRERYRRGRAWREGG